MIVAIDGNVYVGKSRLLAHARSRGVVVVDEYEPVKGRAGSPEGQLAIQEGYLYQEEGRLCLIQEQQRRGAVVLALDRSFLSLAAHVHALSQLGGWDLRRRFALCLIHRIAGGRVVTPDVFVHLTAPWPAIRRRWEQGEASTGPKGTPANLAGRSYCAAIDGFHAAWREALGPASTLGLTVAEETNSPHAVEGPAATWDKIQVFAEQAERAAPAAIIRAVADVMDLPKELGSCQ